MASIVAYYIFEPEHSRSRISENAEESARRRRRRGGDLRDRQPQKLEPGTSSSSLPRSRRHLRRWRRANASCSRSAPGQGRRRAPSRTRCCRSALEHARLELPNAPVPREITVDQLPPELRHLAGGQPRPSHAGVVELVDAPAADRLRCPRWRPCRCCRRAVRVGATEGDAFRRAGVAVELVDAPARIVCDAAGGRAGLAGAGRRCGATRATLSVAWVAELVDAPAAASLPCRVEAVPASPVRLSDSA